MHNYVKFEFVLEILKFVVFRASTLFGMMNCTDDIQDNPVFLKWFVQTEMRIEKQQEIIEIYLANNFSLEFMLLMMIFDIYHSAQDAPQLAEIARSVNLLG